MSIKLDSLLKRHGLTQDQVSISFHKRTGLKTWEPFFEFNADKQMIPASLTKIVTALAVCEIYPKNYQFVTELKSSAKVKTGVLDGDLYLVGAGDPTLVTERLWLLVHELKRLNIQKITGNLIFDNTVFDEVKFSPTRTTNDQRAYSAPVSGLSLNWNALFIRVFGTEPGQKARVYIDPPDASIRLKNNAITGVRTNLLVDRVSTPEHDSVVVTGSIKPGEEYGVYRSHTQPSRRAANQTMSLLNLYGVQVEGTIKQGQAPAAAQTLAKIESVSVDEINKMMMKFSNNFIAEMLTKKMDELANQKQGTLLGGLKIVEKVAKDFTGKSFVLKNPSGLTTENKMSSAFFTDILTKATSKSEYNAEFLATFPRSGIDGTLKKRFVKIPGKVRAKTGLLNGVVGLAGYIESNNGHEYAFSLIYNGPNKQRGRATDMFDLLTEMFVTQY
ncbi:MAG: D-alanyl-D-alanine carboxypeptidase/D-alanyl-D-alanine-endopeptidase [Bdellovibrionaceae bacterium]|nr:D-alanyl-D-alanine carboxypeptidase/D-alanyl-D-alanine-endopeptidase [Pseudobdellovibrionaceae bacterium]